VFSVLMVFMWGFGGGFYFWGGNLCKKKGGPPCATKPNGSGGGWGSKTTVLRGKGFPQKEKNVVQKEVLCRALHQAAKSANIQNGQKTWKGKVRGNEKT